MIEENITSNAQSWELEVVCKNVEYMTEIVEFLAKQWLYNFNVEVVEYSPWEDGKFTGRYLVTVWCAWFSNLNTLTKKLKDIEKKHEKL